MRGERPVEIVADREHAGARLRVLDDGRALVVEQPTLQRVISEMCQLFVVDAGCSTEQYVGRYSVMAAVDDRGGQVGELALAGVSVPEP